MYPSQGPNDLFQVIKPDAPVQPKLQKFHGYKMSCKDIVIQLIMWLVVTNAVVNVWGEECFSKHLLHLKIYLHNSAYLLCNKYIVAL